MEKTATVIDVCALVLQCNIKVHFTLGNIINQNN